MRQRGDIPLAVHYLRGRIAGIEQDILTLHWKAAHEDNVAARIAYLDEYEEASRLLDQLRELMRRAGQAPG